MVGLSSTSVLNTDSEIGRGWEDKSPVLSSSTSIQSHILEESWDATTVIRAHFMCWLKLAKTTNHSNLNLHSPFHMEMYMIVSPKNQNQWSAELKGEKLDFEEEPSECIYLHKLVVSPCS
jgi:hypothetical protein